MNTLVPLPCNLSFCCQCINLYYKTIKYIMNIIFFSSRGLLSYGPYKLADLDQLSLHRTNKTLKSDV